MFRQGNPDTKLYDILGVDKNVSESELKKTYRKLAMKYHPDKCKGSDDEKQKFNDRFKKISHAYDILKDKEKRQHYDRFGEEGVQQMGGGGGFNSDPFDMFQNFFGGRHRVKKSKDKVRDIKITLEEIYNKSVKNLQINQKVCCSACDGSGAYSPAHVLKCKFCNGKGNIARLVNLGNGMAQQFMTTCDNCNGEGKIVNKNCEKCKGSKTEMKEKKVKLEITNEFRTGKKILFSEMSDYQTGCDINGDLILIVEVINHSVFELQGTNLIMKKTISLAEALCGTHFNITHLDKRKISFKTNGIINPYQEYYIPGEGMEGGDLIIKFTINFPTRIEDSTKNQLLNLFPIQSKEPVLDKIKHIHVRNKYTETKNKQRHNTRHSQQQEGGVECNNQ